MFSNTRLIEKNLVQYIRMKRFLKLSKKFKIKKVEEKNYDNNDI